MPQHLAIFRWMVCGFIVGGISVGSGQAASVSGDARRGTLQSVFIDLTSGKAEQSRVEAYVSLDLPSNREASASSGMPRTRFVDLSNGGSPDAPQETNGAAPKANQIVITADQLTDPYEQANRGRFETHLALHRNLIDPVEYTYIGVVPQSVRVGLHNFLTNLEAPSVFANDVLQGQPYRAADTVARFVINSTIGIAGIFDVATRFRIFYRDDDFGQTLAVYGVGDAPYLLVPVIGPTNPRDLTGKIVDVGLNPLRYLALPDGIITSIGHAGLHELDKRSKDVGELDALTRTSADPYAFERSMARERRKAEINKQ